MSIGMASNIRKKISKYFLILATVGLVSCSSETFPELSIESVSIIAEPDANQNSAIAVDLVIIYSEDLVKILGQMSASKYFGDSKQLLLDNPSLLDIWHWELVPGQIVQSFEPPQEEGDAYAAYIFANYITHGDHRVKVAPDGNVKVLLMKNDLKNLSKSKTTDARLGSTMSKVARKPQKSDGDEDGCQLDEPETARSTVRLGPTTYPRQPCNTCLPASAGQVRASGSPNVCPPLGKPIPIVTRPLDPPSGAVRQQSHYKVKNGANKY